MSTPRQFFPGSSQRAELERLAAEEQAAEASKAAARRHSAHEITDPPPPPVPPQPPPAPAARASSHSVEAQPATPPGTLKKHGESWTVIGAMLGVAFTIVNLGISFGRRDSEHATTGDLSKLDTKLSGKVDELLTQFHDLDKRNARIEQMLTDNKASEVKPLADQASKNALDAQAAAAKAQGDIDMVKRSIRGFNSAEARRGHATPLPLQDDR